MPETSFEEPPRFPIADETGLDETGVNLKAYVETIAPEKLAQFKSEWTDEQVMAWDGNFRSDGCLMLVCCTREVEIPEFRDAIQARLASL